MANTVDTSASDLSTNCFTCEPLSQYIDLVNSFVDKLSAALINPILIIFSSLVGLWVVVVALKLVVGMVDVKKIGHDFIYITISCFLLGGQSLGLVSYIFNLSMDIMGGASEIAFSVVSVENKSTGYDGIVHLAATASLAVAKVIQVASVLVREGSLYNPQYFLYAFILVAPFFVFVVSYAFQVIVAIFRLVMYAVLSTFFAMSYAFDWGRGLASSTGKGLLGSIVVLFACSVALALTISGVNEISIDPVSISSGELDEFASISNPRFLAILFLGIIGSALMTEGTSLVNSCMQTMFSNAAAGIMTAGASAVAVMTSKKMNPLTMGSRYADAAQNIGKNIGGYAAMGSHAMSATKGIGSGLASALSRPAAAQDFLNRYNGGAS
ncbi:MAG: hypothetical protein JXQ84_06430 [Rhodospirillaceae bacterium]|nr:hypothetical protein [Rhodospirillaceae bacterium]